LLNGFSRGEPIGKTTQELFNDGSPKSIEAQDREVMETGRVVEREIESVVDGVTLTMLAIKFPIPDDEGNIAGIGAIVTDITARKRAEKAQLEHVALYDPLTNLPNRTLFRDRLEHALRKAQRDSKPLALLLLDLDRFKSINDTLGHAVGDVVLREAAKRLEQPIRKSDTIARLGGDEFAVILGATDTERALNVAARIGDTMRTPIDLNGLALEVGVSIGIALFPEQARDAGGLLQCADVAMYQAKEDRSSIAIYDQVKDRNSVRYLTLTGELRKAIENDGLAVHYQPKIDLLTSRVSGLEVLARWQHPTHGFIPPDEFIPHAEQTGLINPLTEWVFNAALAQLAEWRNAGLKVDLSVNLSARTLHDERLPKHLARLLEQWQLDPRCLTLEITESAIMFDPEGALKVANELHALGVRLSVDDFGTGHSSLVYLKRFPLHELKIDKSFVMQMTQDENDAVIVRATIDLAHNLGLNVTAEGIETEQHAKLLKALGCEVGQGYFFSRPLPAIETTEWLGQRNGERFDPAAMKLRLAKAS
jgi:diguanylate cyclase (GGDEF)-like protein/PAS domain S-box-containing protein